MTFDIPFKSWKLTASQIILDCETKIVFQDYQNLALIKYSSDNYISQILGQIRCEGVSFANLQQFDEAECKQCCKTLLVQQLSFHRVYIVAPGPLTKKLSGRKLIRLACNKESLVIYVTNPFDKSENIYLGRLSTPCFTSHHHNFILPHFGKQLILDCCHGKPLTSFQHCLSIAIFLWVLTSSGKIKTLCIKNASELHASIFG